MTRFTAPQVVRPTGLDLDFNPLNQGIDAIGNALMRRREDDINKALGAAAQERGLEGLQDEAYGRGKIDLGMRAGNILEQRKERARVAGRQAAQAAESARRFDATHKLAEERLQVQRDQAKTRKMTLLDQRNELASRLGFRPGTPEYTQIMTTGKLASGKGAELSPRAEKEIIETDDRIAAGQEVLRSLDLAIKLNPDAAGGIGAETYSNIIANLPDIGLGLGTRADKALQLNQIITQQALSQLRATFGAVPTEGERKILLEVQGSISQPPQVRAQIFARARAAAQRKLAEDQSRIERLRSGQYFQPGGGVATPTPQAPAAQSVPAAPAAPTVPQGAQAPAAPGPLPATPDNDPLGIR
ncbi:MAG: hypothetical protein GDA50_04235 [Alphaproteobacteria bacterium GM202ARS2]|nr:hypothetical protein [Alphaproteobacteria bacterium GM202ARS2]